MAVKVFIDTEFTDFIDTQLISIGMVSQSGEEFYAEVPYSDNSCSAFVREAVIPLLGKLPNAACSIEELGEKITVWIDSVRGDDDVEVCFDYQTDWDLFADVLDYRLPPWCKPRLINREIDKSLQYDFHKKNQLPEHHALYDALANRYAFLKVEDDANS